MKLSLIAFACFAVVSADINFLASNEYVPPIQDISPAEAPESKFILDVPKPLPVQADTALVPAHVVQQPALVEASPSHILADDGYRYKTHRRLVYRRNRRDVSHLPTNDYLPPVQEAPVSVPVNDYLPPVQQPALVEASPSHILADDGYRYKTHRRLVYRRNRRDVSHLPTNDYLPPVQEAPVSVPVNDYLPPVQQPALVEASPSHVLADDGYRYKTHRRVVYRRQ